VPSVLILNRLKPKKEMNMEQKEKKSINQYMRSLHRDIGFFVIGLIVIYSLSGVVLVYRETNFLKYETLVEKKLSPNTDLSELGKVLHLRDFEVIKTEGEIVYFQNGTYNKETGVAKYSAKELPLWINRLTNLHKSSSKSLVHWVTTVFGILLLFLAISSFWMFNTGSKLFRRGIYFAVSGILVAIILVIL
jgi:hypothetical protein